MTDQNRTASQKNTHAKPPSLELKFKIIPAPEKLREEVECFRIAEYTGEGGLAIKISLNGLPGIVFQHHEVRSPVESIITPSRRNSSIPTLLTNFLLARLKQEKTRDRLVEESLRLIHKNIGSVTVRTLLEHLHISERHFVGFLQLFHPSP